MRGLPDLSQFIGLLDTQIKTRHILTYENLDRSFRRLVHGRDDTYTTMSLASPVFVLDTDLRVDLNLSPIL